MRPTWGVHWGTRALTKSHISIHFVDVCIILYKELASLGLVMSCILAMGPSSDIFPGTNAYAMQVGEHLQARQRTCWLSLLYICGLFMALPKRFSYMEILHCPVIFFQDLYLLQVKLTNVGFLQRE